MNREFYKDELCLSIRTRQSAQKITKALVRYKPHPRNRNKLAWQTCLIEQYYLRDYEANDRDAIFEQLAFLPLLYPNGQEWLERRLGQVETGEARCTVAVWKSAILGLTIETPKPNRCMKLSTLFVATEFRSLGIGSALLSRCRVRWLEDDIRFAYLTADMHLVPSITPSVIRIGFNLMDIQHNRYGSGRDEAVYKWSPQGKHVASGSIVSTP